MLAILFLIMTKRTIDQIDDSDSTTVEERNLRLKQATHDIKKTHALLLSRLNGAELPAKLHDMDNEYKTLYKLLKQTVTLGESNSCLLIGNRGTGKTALVRTVLKDLEKLKQEFCVVKLSGLTEVNDKLALNEISRQLAIEQDQGDRSFVSTK